MTTKREESEMRHNVHDKKTNSTVHNVFMLLLLLSILTLISADKGSNHNLFFSLSRSMISDVRWEKDIQMISNNIFTF